MNNAELADKLTETAGLSRKVVDGVFAAIAEDVAQGDELSISGFGKIKVKVSAAREGT